MRCDDDDCGCESEIDVLAVDGTVGDDELLGVNGKISILFAWLKQQQNKKKPKAIFGSAEVTYLFKIGGTEFIELELIVMFIPVSMCESTEKMKAN